MRKQNANDFTDESLKTYFKEIGGFKPLTKTEEKNLFMKYKGGCQNSKNKLIKANLKFVVSVAKGFRGSGLPMAELVSEGNIGLLKALEQYNPNKDCKLNTYSVWEIRQSMQDAIKKRTRLPMQEMPTKNNENKVGDDDCFVEEFDIEEELELSYVDNTKHKILSSLLNVLDGREKAIVMGYFGLTDNDNTLNILGNTYNISKERVRQIKDKALRKMRSNYLLQRKSFE